MVGAGGSWALAELTLLHRASDRQRCKDYPRLRVVCLVRLLANRTTQLEKYFSPNRIVSLRHKATHIGRPSVCVVDVDGNGACCASTARYSVHPKGHEIEEISPGLLASPLVLAYSKLLTCEHPTSPQRESLLCSFGAPSPTSVAARAGGARQPALSCHGLFATRPRATASQVRCYSNNAHQLHGPRSIVLRGLRAPLRHALRQRRAHWCSRVPK